MTGTPMERLVEAMTLKDKADLVEGNGVFMREKLIELKKNCLRFLLLADRTFLVICSLLESRENGKFGCLVNFKRME
jgi:hypothetical protein